MIRQIRLLWYSTRSADVITWGRLGADPKRQDPFLGPRIMRSMMRGLRCASFARTTEGSKWRAFGPRRSPPPMVWGWKYLHSMQRFLGAILVFVILTICQNGRQNLCMGWRLAAIFGILSKMAKTRCVSDLTKSSFVRYATSFGHFGLFWVKTRCVSD